MSGKVATVGMFDGVHLGHRKVIDFILERVSKNKSEAVIATFPHHPQLLLNPDRAPRILTPAFEKKMLLEQCLKGEGRVEMLEFTPELRQMSALGFIEMLRNRFGVGEIVMGFNNRFGHDRNLEFADYVELGKSAGVDIYVAPELRISDGRKVSSTNIRQALLSGAPDTACEMLGRNYSIRGTVVGGKQLGRTIGFPTANINPDDASRLIPKVGVYAATTTLPDGSEHRTMVNVGRRPSVDVAGDIIVEAHLLDFADKLYGEQVELKFIEYLRDEIKFNSLDELHSQLVADRANVEKFFADRV